jgi:hypothetical protein
VRRVALALDIVRLRTGVVWMSAEQGAGGDAVVLAYGTPSWLITQHGDAIVRLTSGTPDDAIDLIWRSTQDHPHGLITSNRSTDCLHRDDLERPTVDALAAALAGRVLSGADTTREVVLLPALPGGAQFGIALTHDLDYLATTNRYRATRAFYLMQALRRPGRRRAFVHFSRAAATSGAWTHRRDLREECEHGVTSEWYVFARTKANWRGLNARAYNPEYELDAAVADLCADITSAGSVIGLHASPQAGTDFELLALERERLAALAGPIAGVRHHMGRFRWPEALDGWLDAGFSYDSSFIINDAQGYRLGTAAPSPLLARGRCMLEQAPNWLDTVAFNYLGKSPAQMQKELLDIVDAAAARRSIEGVVWHGIPFGQNGNESVYGSFLSHAVTRGGLVAPPRVFVEHARSLMDAVLVPSDDGATLEVSGDLHGAVTTVRTMQCELR